MYISIILSAYINVSTAFGEKHNGLRDSRLPLVRPSGGLRLVADKTTKKKKKIKPRVDYEPRSAHGRAVNKEVLSCGHLTNRAHFSTVYTILVLLNVQD